MPISAAPAQISTVTASTSGGDLSITVGSGVSILAVLVVNAASAILSTVSYNGSGLTRRSTNGDSNTSFITHWDLVSPPAGTLTLALRTSSGTADCYVCALALSGVDTAAPRREVSEGSAFTATTSRVLTTVADDYVISACGANATLTANAPLTQLGVSNYSSTRWGGFGSITATGTSTTTAWTQSTSDWMRVVSVSYIPSAVGGGTIAGGRYRVAGPVR